jgi:acyl-CoA thioester hydrolase
MEPKQIVETTFRVRYAETDASGIVYNSNYLIWFELGRGETITGTSKSVGSVGR